MAYPFFPIGGGSALLPAPVPPVTLQEKQEVTRHLAAAGATIQELNTVRRALSLLKGGGLARCAYPAQVRLSNCFHKAIKQRLRSCNIFKSIELKCSSRFYAVLDQIHNQIWCKCIWVFSSHVQGK